MRRMLERGAALDVHKKAVTVSARISGPGGIREELMAEFETMAADLLALRDWLKAARGNARSDGGHGGVLEAVYYALRTILGCCWSTRSTSRTFPGARPTPWTRSGCASLLECGLLRASFVPPKPIRALRDLTRYRKSLIQERQREANRLHKVLEDAGIKLSCVATDVLGVSGRQMLAALLSGTRDPALLAELAKGKLRSKLPALKRALAGNFQSHHAR